MHGGIVAHCQVGAQFHIVEHLAKVEKTMKAKRGHGRRDAFEGKRRSEPGIGKADTIIALQLRGMQFADRIIFGMGLFHPQLRQDVVETP